MEICRKNEQATYNNTIQWVRIECWLPKDADALLEYVILIAFPQKQWLRERTSVLRFVYIAWLVWLILRFRTRTSILASQLACRDNSHSSLLHLFSEILLAVDWRKLTVHSCQFSAVFLPRPYCTRVSFYSKHRTQTNEVACEFSYACGVTCKRYWHTAIGAQQIIE